ncbi:MAG: M28 family peptidase [Crocinitomicaceae bacterium]
MRNIILYAFLIVFTSASCQDATKKTKTSDVVELTDQQLADTLVMYEHLEFLTKSERFRNHEDIERLDSVAAYIFRDFDQFADTTFYQEFQVGEKTYRNVVCSFGPRDAERIIIGAHYDVCGSQEGADDNASGVVGLLELARLLDEDSLSQRVDLVAYTLEEPPYFRSEYMGSYIHAKSLVDEDVAVAGMICLEMIGYFDDAKGSQEYPVAGMGAMYGSKGDYIALVSQMGPGKFVKDFSKDFKNTKEIKTKEIAAPKSMTGIDFSDHLNYWKFGFSALMITDTAFFRNKNYHEKTDTLETLDLARMADVIDAVYLSVR